MLQRVGSAEFRPGSSSSTQTGANHEIGTGFTQCPNPGSSPLELVSGCPIRTRPQGRALIGNPIDLILQLLISSGGGGVYDVLSDGAGIDETLIDVTEFENIRDTFYPTDVFTLYPSDLPKLIDFIEQELLEANNVRIIKNSVDNLISLVRLDEADPDAIVEEIGDDITVLNSDKWGTTKNGLQTIVKVQWNWVEGLRKFTRSRTFKAPQDILDVFGEVKGRNLKFKGIQAADNGLTIAADRADRYLSRFSTPQTTVKLSGFMKTFPHNIGDKIRVTAKNLPQEGGSLGMSSVIELVKRAVNISTGVVKMEFKFTSYTNIRNGIVSPSDILNLGVTSQKSFTVVDGTCYNVGFVMRLMSSVSGKWKTTTDSPNTIQSIVGNVVTMTNDFTTILGPTTAFVFADYDEVNEEQKAKYAFIVGDSNFFLDGSKGYQIIL